jgi:hypothetical protein
MQVAPADARQELREGTAAKFEARVADADQQGADLRYQWLLDGSATASGPVWEFTPAAADAGRRHEVKVVATAGTRRLEHAWEVDVIAVNRAPSIVSARPAEATVTLDQGDAVRLSVETSDPDLERGDRLAFVWRRNGATVRDVGGPSYELRDPRDGEEVSVAVADAEGLSGGTHSWRLALRPPPPPPNRPPRIVSRVPADGRLSLAEGDATAFSIRAEDPDRGEPLQLVWYLDGAEVARGETWRFTAPATRAARSRHRVEAEVSDPAGLSAPRAAWDVEVTGRPPRFTRSEPSAKRPLRASAGARLGPAPRAGGVDRRARPAQRSDLLDHRGGAAADRARTERCGRAAPGGRARAAGRRPDGGGRPSLARPV